MTKSDSRCDVLVVEDDLDVSAVMETYLTRHGLTVCTAHSGSSALYILQKVWPRVAIVDYRLPDLDGVQLSQKLLQHLPNLPIIMMSGAIGSLEQSTLEKIGIKVFVNKPVPLRSLLRAVLQLLERS
jgi:DNA-binding NtrC family response regulator